MNRFMPAVCRRPVLLYSMTLLMHLKEYRQVQSLAEKIPLYCVFGDTVIKSVAEVRPKTLADLQTIRGLSDEKRDRYGEDILRIVRGNPDDPPRAVPPAVTRSTSTPPVVMRHARRTSALDPWTKRKALLKTFEVSRVNTASQRIPGIPAGKEGIYILELAQGRVYVGHSSDVRRRIQQHMAGQGAAFTKAFPPTGVILPRLGCVTGSPEAAERDETLRYMFLRGIPVVRGWKFVRVEMPEDEAQDAEENIRELFDLCRRCGHPGHFITHCKATFDRLGKPCKT